MADRNIADLDPTFQSSVTEWEVQMKAKNADNIITCTRRTQAEQDDLWAQGRTKPGPIVTWTKHSQHLVGKAFDFVIMFAGKPDWQMHHRNLWDTAIQIGKDLGMHQVVNKEGRVIEEAHLQAL
jgi:peptidoglycan LD-endopeptidase CwlK